MVLAELGGKLRASLNKLNSTSTLDESALNAILSDIARALIEADVKVQLVMSLRETIKQKTSKILSSSSNTNPTYMKRVIQKEVIQALVDLLETKESKPYVMKRGKPNVILFVGLQGAGKTTTIAKFANYYLRKGWKTSMVCADTFRAGAFDQLKQNATKLRCAFYGSYTEADPVLIAEDGVKQFKKEKYEVIIVDTSGRHRQEAALFEEMQEISAAINPNNTVFVMDATQGQAVYDQALGFHDAVDVGSVIVTKLDGHAKGGGALSAVAATQSPIIFLGSGEHFDDLDSFNARSFVSKLLGFGDMRGLVEEMKAIQDQPGGVNREEMIEKLKKGKKLTLRDMQKQFDSVMKMGPMSKFMGMIPGIPQQVIPKDDDKNNYIKKFMYIMDSMTDAELDGKVDLHKKDAKTESRIRRIAVGSGTHPDEVRMLLQSHKQMENVAAKVGKSGMLKASNDKRAAAAMKNPALMQKHLRNLNPQQAKMLEQMGGAGNMMNMMQGMGGMPGGGLPPNMDMAQMAKAMQGMGGMPGMGSGMPDMSQMAQMMQSMGMGGNKKSGRR